uniref:Lipoyl-binding domain-containing protein n=1 Tax=Macrostomum lignano TaxID=282301 RepID=A0A1I8IGY0_9PLAT
PTFFGSFDRFFPPKLLRPSGIGFIFCEIRHRLQIGMGLPLHRIKEIRVLYRQDPLGSSEIDFDSPDTQPEPSGHVIAARITSENPDEGFKPSTGAVQDLIFRGSKNVWGYFSVVSTGGLHEFADSQFGHCFSFGDHREAARENLIIALKELSIRSDFRTTVEYLIRLLEDESFAENRINTGWLDRLIAERVRTEKPNAFLAVISASLHLAYQELRTVLHQVVSELDRGQSCNMGHLKNSVTLELVHQNVKYRLEVVQSGESSYFLLLNGSCLEAEAHRLGDGGLLLSLNGSSYSTYSCIEATGYRVIIDNQTCTLEKEHDPTVLMSPSPGKLLRFTVPDGGHVTQDSVYAEIEVMKMVMELRASESGCVRHQKRPGAQVAAGEQLASLELDDPSRVRQAELYTGDSRPAWPARSRTPGLRLNQIVERIVQQLKSALQGYVIPEPNFSEWMVQQVETLLVSLKDPALPLVELKEMMSQVSGRIPTLLEQRIREQMAKIRQQHHQLQEEPRHRGQLRVLAQPGGLQEPPDRLPAAEKKFVQSDKTLLDDLREALIRLTTLRRADNASVVLKARQLLLIYSQTPAYELRHNQVESFFLSYISSGNSSYLEQLIQAETSIFDLIPDFFFHHDPLVRIAACEHSVLRSCNKFVLDFRFLLPSSHPNR